MVKLFDNIFSLSPGTYMTHRRGKNRRPSTTSWACFSPFFEANDREVMIVGNVRGDVNFLLIQFLVPTTREAIKDTERDMA